MPDHSVVFLYIHEMQHQILHTLPIMQALADRAPQVKIKALVRGTENFNFVKKYLSDDALARIELVCIEVSPLADFTEKLIGRSIPIGRFAFLLAGFKHLRSADMIVTPETTSSALKRLNSLPNTTFVHIPHGAGDRAVSVEKAIGHFDHVLLPGAKTQTRLIDEGVVQADSSTVIGYPKFAAIKGRALTGRDLFGNDNPVFVYNPHFDPYLSSWYTSGTAIMDLFLGRPDLNLIVAPHVMMYRRRVQIAKKQRVVERVPGIDARYTQAPNIIIDTGSERCIDMTYTMCADVYIGDVSSQVYEFIKTPRPVVYVNANGHDWNGNADFRFWDFGTVVEGADGLAAYIDAKDYGSNRHEAAQRDAFEATFGTDIDRSAERAVASIQGLLDAGDGKARSLAASRDQARSQTGRIFRNFGKLASGKVIAAVLSLAYLAIVARTLGPDGMGYLVLAHAYVVIIEQISRFQSWQAIIRFGDPLLEKNNREGFKALIRFTLKLDIVSAVLAVGVALALLGPVSRLMDWPADAMPAIAAYCWAAPFMFAATPIGLLRLWDRFGTLS